MSGVAAATSLAVGVYSANRASKAAQNAANTSANAQLEAARIAADVQRFKPVGITTRFGRSQFGFDPEGNLQSAGYTATPEIQALQDRLSGLYNLSLGQAEQAVGLQPGISQQAQGLFNLGQGYLAESPEQARQRFMNQQYALLDPVRQREEERLGAGVFGRGRAGLNIGDIGQPELFALASARRQQDLELAQQAEAASQQQIGFGTGLLGQGLNLQQSGYGLQTAALGPFQSQFGLVNCLNKQHSSLLTSAHNLVAGLHRLVLMWARLCWLVVKVLHRLGCRVVLLVLHCNIILYLIFFVILNFNKVFKDCLINLRQVIIIGLETVALAPQYQESLGVVL
jgi:hypothetical protein